MELTGKCKEEFLKWYKDVFSVKEDIHDDGNSLNYMPYSMKYGVYVDYFDSVLIYLTCGVYGFKMVKQNGCALTKKNKNRSQARTEAIKKANELRNEQLKK